ncbi:hypothetical protein E2C01_001802 [Portunus trituberculatus]|uniref:Uncharacterized protein n=1 Tax=Portunus trituberculatus TaxID=210409 RepID=A0A5B7CI86_PORTR|nr:hypothetical protein [Portunus trituberculatus]
MPPASPSRTKVFREVSNGTLLSARNAHPGRTSFARTTNCTQALRDEFSTLLPRLQSRTRSVSRTPSRGRRRTRSPPSKPQSSKTDLSAIFSSPDEAELRSSKKKIGGPSDHYDPHTPYFYHSPNGRVYYQAYPPIFQEDFLHDPLYDYSRHEDDVTEAQFSEAEENPAAEAVDNSEDCLFSPDNTLERTTSVTLVLPPEGTVEAQVKTAATEDSNSPTSSPEDQLTKVFYPPDGASAIFEGATSQVIFHYKYKSYGKFKIVESDSLSFRVVY